MTTVLSGSELIQERILRFFGRHLVGLGITYITLDNQGKRSGPERFFAASGFVMSFQDEWYYVTAGHVLQTELDEPLAKRQIEVTRAFLVATGSADGVDQSMKWMPIPYPEMPRAYIDDREFGLDIGLIHLRTLFRQGLEGFEVMPIAERQWRDMHLVKFDFYCMMGYPAAFNAGELPEDRYGDAMSVSMRATLMSLERLDQMPRGSEISTLPWFIGRMPRRAVPIDIRGMSGCPIFGFGMGSDGALRYWVVALQSRRSKIEPDTILACPVEVFAPMLERTLLQLDTAPRTQVI